MNDDINKVIFQLTSNQMKLIALLVDKNIITQDEADKLLGNKKELL